MTKRRRMGMAAARQVIHCSDAPESTELRLAGTPLGPRASHQVRTRLEVVDVADDERIRRWRQALAFVAAGVVVAGAVGVLSLVTEGGGASRASGDASGGESTASIGTVPWDGARLEGDRLTLYFTGARPARAGDPCSRAYEAVAEPTEDTIVVTVRAFAPAPGPPDQPCTAVGYSRSVAVNLPEPLRGRTVVDGATGQRKTISDAAALLTPSWLPAGYHFSTESVTSDTDSSVHEQVWAQEGPSQTRLLVEQGGEDPNELGTPGFEPVVLDRPTVRGRPATLWKSEGFDDLICVSWIEGSTGHRVCSSGTPGELLLTDALIRVADGLRGHDSP